MYSAKTLFFWFLVLNIRGFRWFEYGLLLLLRSPVNMLMTRCAGSKGIIINDAQGNNVNEEEGGSSNVKTVHVQVRNPNTFIRILNGGSLAVAESYMDGWWGCDAVGDLCVRLFDLFEAVRFHPMISLMDWITLNAHEKPWEGARDGWLSQVGEDFFRVTLGEHNLYMCGHWEKAETLEQAQTDNMRLLGRKLKLAPGMKLLDLGCGYGQLTRSLANEFGIEAIGCTNSAEEANKAKEYSCPNVKTIQCDYKEIQGKFDRIVCVQMLEHLGGPAHYKSFFEKIDSLLAPDGLLLLQTNIFTTKPPLRTDQFARKYLFTSSVAPHTLEIFNAADPKFLVEDVHNMGSNMEKTILACKANLDKGWQEFLSQKYEPKYYRMFNLYLQVLIALAKSRRVQLWQLVLTKKESVQNYESVR